MPAHEFQNDVLHRTAGDPHHRGRHRLTWIRMMRELRWLHRNGAPGRRPPSQRGTI
jgi:hypothetical protein